MINKIEDTDLVGKGVIDMDDVPHLPAKEMQEKLEETARDVIIPRLNDVIAVVNVLEEADTDDVKNGGSVKYVKYEAGTNTLSVSDGEGGYNVVVNGNLAPGQQSGLMRAYVVLPVGDTSVRDAGLLYFQELA